MKTNYATYPSLDGRVVLITGGSAGIGAAMVEAFHAQGAKVAFLDIDEKKAETLRDRLTQKKCFEPYFLKCDVRDIGQLQNCIKKISNEVGNIHTLVNNAGGTERLSANKITLDKWENFQSLNLRHVLFASQAVFPNMQLMGEGSIINFTSPTFRRRTEGWAGYAAAKSGIEGLSRILAREYGESNIRVNSICSGGISRNQPNEFVTKYIQKTPLKRMANESDFLGVMAYLASDMSLYVTGQVIQVDGGWGVW